MQLHWERRSVERTPAGRLHHLSIPLGGPSLPGSAGRRLALEVNARYGRSASESRVIVLVGPAPHGQRLLVFMVAHPGVRDNDDEHELGQHLGAALSLLFSEEAGALPPR